MKCDLALFAFWRQQLFSSPPKQNEIRFSINSIDVPCKNIALLFDQNYQHRKLVIFIYYFYVVLEIDLQQGTMDQNVKVTQRCLGGICFFSSFQTNNNLCIKTGCNSDLCDRLHAQIFIRAWFTSLRAFTASGLMTAILYTIVDIRRFSVCN